MKQFYEKIIRISIALAYQGAFYISLYTVEVSRECRRQKETTKLPMSNVPNPRARRHEVEK